MASASHYAQAITKRQFESPFELQVWVKTAINGNGGALPS